MAALSLLRTLLAVPLFLYPVVAKNPPFLDAGFAFDYVPPGAPVPIPTTEQCEVIHITWGRASWTTGPDPVGPYYLQVYTSTSTTPFLVPGGDGLTLDWPVPFSPGTQYQICMFDKNGNTGGCLRQYTVIPSSNSSTPTCANVTAPAPLNARAVTRLGEMGQFAWIDSCTDISVSATDGTPPYTLTIAPALHPPWNITSDTLPINWTVEMTWSSAFFLSMSDNAGRAWAQGPLHSGKGSNDCLVSSTTSSGTVSQPVVIGSSVGGLALGAVIGIGAAWFFWRRRKQEGPHFDQPYDLRNAGESFSGKGAAQPFDSPINTNHYSAIPGHSPRRSEPDVYPTSPQNAHPSRHGHTSVVSPGAGYAVEPFRMPGDASDVMSVTTHSSRTQVGGHRHQDSAPLSPTGGHVPVQNMHAMASGETSSSGLGRSPSSNVGRAVYVVHHDSGQAPVSVYTSEGTDVIELPPSYDGNSGGQDRRQPGATPRKQLPMPPNAPGPSGS